MLRICSLHPLILVTVALLNAFPAALVSAEQLSGTVISVPDGDSLVVQSQGVKTRVRMFGVDAPEKDQPFAADSRAFSKSRLRHQRVNVEVKRRDHYGRVVGVVRLADGTIFQEELLKKGYAWVYRRYTANPLYIAAEQNAKRRRLGLWQETSPTPPWEYRRSHNIGYKSGKGPQRNNERKSKEPFREQKTPSRSPQKLPEGTQTEAGADWVDNLNKLIWGLIRLF